VPLMADEKEVDTTDLATVLGIIFTCAVVLVVLMGPKFLEAFR
jgi:hypothetical protein